jgi:hypothetical protein
VRLLVVLADVLPVDVNLSASDDLFACQALEGGALTSSIYSQQTEALVVLQAEGNALHSFDLGFGLSDLTGVHMGGLVTFNLVVILGSSSWPVEGLLNCIDSDLVLFAACKHVLNSIGLMLNICVWTFS